MGANTLAAHQAAISTGGHNIANANTEGFTRQRASMTTAPSSNGVGEGVRQGEVVQMVDRFTNSKILQELPKGATYETRQGFLEKLETVFNEVQGVGLREHLNHFWSSWSALANEPESDAARSQLTERSDALAGKFRQMYGELKTLREEANSKVALGVDQINGIANKIMDLNQKITQSEFRHIPANDARDQRSRYLADLAKIIDINPVENEAGAVIVSTAVGWTLVEPMNVNPLQATRTGGELGMYTIEGTGSGALRADLSDRFTDGELKSLLEIRDHTIVGFMNELDEMAFGLADRVNQFHSTGTGMNSGYQVAQSSFGLSPDAQQEPLPFVKNGVFQLHLVDPDQGILETYEVEVRAGADTLPDIVDAINQTVQDPSLLEASLEPDGSVKIMAKQGNQFIFGQDSSGFGKVMGFNSFFETLKGAEDIRLSEHILKDSNQISTGQDLIPGDNRTALGIAKLQITPTLRDGTMTIDEFYNSLLAKLGLTIQKNMANQEHQTNLVSQLNEIRNNVSGVSIDEEVAKMAQYQKGYQAAAKFISTVDEMTQSVIQMV